MKRTASAILILFPIMISAADEPKDKGLESFVGKDLRFLDEKDSGAFQKRYSSLTAEKIEFGLGDDLKPWWVKSFGAGKCSWILLQGYPGIQVPDVSYMVIHAFDKDWKRLAKQEIPTEYRFRLEEVTTSKNDSLKQDLLVAKVICNGPFLEAEGEKPRPLFEQGDFQRQYYALLDDHFVLVRMEDDKGHLVGNSYCWSKPVKGPEVPKKSRDEWIRSLKSSNRVEQLATLVWLTGRHLPSSDKREKNINQESVEDSKSFEEVRDAAETKKAIAELANSKNVWVKEYANLPRIATEPK
jgi:hypothetical protein